MDNRVYLVIHPIVFILLETTIKVVQKLQFMNNFR